LPSARERQGLLDAAYATGIRHFDVARTYGLGAAESELGRFAAARRNEIVLATKFGLTQTAAARRLGAWQAPVRAAIRRVPGLRIAARRVAGAAIGDGRDYSAAAARSSLETSLRSLRTEWIDLFFLHEPPVGAAVSDDLVEFLESARDAGTIRAWGVSGEPAPSLAVAASLPLPPRVLQLRGEAGRPLPPAAFERGGAVITYGVLSSGRPARRAERDDVLPELLIRAALQHNPGGVVLFGTTRRDHLEQVARAGVADEVRDRAARGLFDATIAP
jgi:D-threo-aldose 1-dehydrogenase